MNPFWMVLADLRRTVLSSLGILLLLTLAFSASMVVSLVERGLRTAGVESAQDYDLVVGAPGSRLDLVLAALYLKTDETLPLLEAGWLETLATDPRVEAVSGLAFADRHSGGPIVGVGADFPRLRPSLRLVEGRWPEKALEAVAGSRAGWRVGDEFHGIHGTEGEVEDEHEDEHHGEYLVVGVLAATGTPWDQACLTPLEGVWAQHGLESGGGVSAVLVKPKDFAAAYSLRAEFRQGQTTAAFPGEVLAGLFGLFDQAKVLVGWVGLLFQTLVFAAVVLSLLAGLPSKARWIGLLRALGASPVYVVLTLWLQNALVFAGAGLGAALVGWWTAQGLAVAVAQSTGLVLPLAWATEETLLLVGFWSIGLVGALVPAVLGYQNSVRRALNG